jgi:ABC-2 type transport system permease protein
VIEAAEHTWYMIGRQARNLLREPIWIVLMLVQPMVWLLLYGQLFKKLPTGLPGFGTNSYIEFLTPGIVVMNAFFGGTWAGMAMITDLDRGVIERFLATRVSRISLVFSQVARAGFTAAIQTLIILTVALFLGARIDAGAPGWLVILAASALVAATFAGISHGIALLVRREATMIAMANFIGLPLFFMSTALISRQSIPGWIQWAAKFNPLEWGVVSAREVTLSGTDWGSVAFNLGLLAAAVAAAAAFATWTFRSYQRTL